MPDLTNPAVQSLTIYTVMHKAFKCIFYRFYLVCYLLYLLELTQEHVDHKVIKAHSVAIYSDHHNFFICGPIFEIQSLSESL